MAHNVIGAVEKEFEDNMLVYELLDDNIKGDNFKQFLLFCLENSDYCSVTVSEGNKVIDGWNDFLYQSFLTYSWYCYKTYEAPLNVILYHSAPSLSEGLLKYFGCLFPEYTQGVEDICFIKNNKIMFGSVTHERIAQIVLSSETGLKDYEKFAAWKRIALSGRDYDFYPDLENIRSGKI